MSSPITSRGCCRAMILCVLYRCLEYVQTQYEHSESIQCPFPEAEVNKWIKEAQSDCQDPDFQSTLGGTPFTPSDSATFWNSHQQYYTWWKNNIERKSKFQALQRDGQYSGADPLERARATYCRNAVALALNIKKHFDRFSIIGGHRIQCIQLIPIPHAMPSHMNTVRKISFIKCLEDDEIANFNSSECIEHACESVVNSPAGIEQRQGPLEIGITSPREIESIETISPEISRRETRPYKKRMLNDLFCPIPTRARRQKCENVPAIQPSQSTRLQASFRRQTIGKPKFKTQTAFAPRPVGRPRKLKEGENKQSHRTSNSVRTVPSSINAESPDDTLDIFSLLAEGDLFQDSKEEINVSNDFDIPARLEGLNLTVFSAGSAIKINATGRKNEYSKINSWPMTENSRSFLSLPKLSQLQTKLKVQGALDISNTFALNEFSSKNPQPLGTFEMFERSIFFGSHERLSFNSPKFLSDTVNDGHNHPCHLFTLETIDEDMDSD